MTSSSWIVNSRRTRVLMVYYYIYNSWSWTGGHSDGNRDLLEVALREAREETDIKHVRPVSRDINSLDCTSLQLNPTLRIASQLLSVTDLISLIMSRIFKEVLHHEYR